MDLAPVMTVMLGLYWVSSVMLGLLSVISDIGNFPMPCARYQAATMGFSSVLTAILVLESGVR